MFINVTVRPGAKKDEITESAPSSFHIKTSALAKENKANEAVINMIGEYFNIAKSRVRIIRGHTARKKIVEII